MREIISRFESIVSSACQVFILANNVSRGKSEGCWRGHKVTTGEGQSHSCNYCRNSSNGCNIKLHMRSK